MNVCRIVCGAYLAIVLLNSSIACGAENEFESHVAPLIARRCLGCHLGATARGGLDLSTRASAVAGGESGPAIGETAAASLLWKRLEAGEMPVDAQGTGTRLPNPELKIIRDWLDQGAPWPAERRLDLYEQTTDERAGYDWWAFQPIRRSALPQGEASSVIDRWIRVEQMRHGLEPAPRAAREILIRRLYFDLLGIPPTPAQIERFVADRSINAWERLVDQTLASPQYGERWGRHWLDVVRYADTCGYERDQVKPNIWRYRDWVISAFNHDLPYSQFMTEQVAGDEVPGRNEQTVIATGFIRAGTWNDEPNDPADYVYDRLEDMVHTTSSAFLGLSVKCARCHDHKFDPIPQTDYYRIASFFWSGYIGQENLGGPTAEQLGYEAFGWTDRARTAPPLHRLRNGERTQPLEAVEPGFLTAIRHLNRPVAPPASEATTTTRRLQFAQWLADSTNPLPARVLVNRLWMHHFGQAIVRTPNNFGRKSDPPTHPELLDYLAAELLQGNWHIKRIQRMILLSDTYQQSCDHPRQAEYEQVDATNRTWWRANRRRLDAETLRDRLLFASHQLELRIGGPSFTPTMSAEALEGLSRKSQDWQPSPLSEQRRRSVYMLSRRSRLLPFMTVFDFTDTTMTCAQRDVSIVPTQALALLNNEFVHGQSLTLARELLAPSERTSPSLSTTVERAWLAVLGRAPQPREANLGIAHIEAQRAAYTRETSEAGQLAAEPSDPPLTLAVASLCHVLMNSNEFVFVD